MGEAETLKGARARVQNAQQLAEADFYCGLEGGCDVDEQVSRSFAAVCFIFLRLCSAAVCLCLNCSFICLSCLWRQGLHCFAWIVCYEKATGIETKAKTATCPLPTCIHDIVKEGKELGQATDIIFRKHNSKQSSGVVGALTDNVINRETYYEHAALLALVPLKNRAMYFPSSSASTLTGPPQQVVEAVNH